MPILISAFGFIDDNFKKQGISVKTMRPPNLQVTYTFSKRHSNNMEDFSQVQHVTFFFVIYVATMRLPIFVRN